MKKILLTILIYFCFNSYASASLISMSESFVLEFDTLPFIELNSAQAQGGATMYFTSDLLDSGERAELEFFEDSLLALPFFTWEFTTPTDHFGATVVIPTPWQDFQGIVKLTMLSGQVNLDSIAIQVFTGEAKYFQTFSADPIPEPTTMLLLGSGLIGLAGFSRRKFRK